MINLFAYIYYRIPSTVIEDEFLDEEKNEYVCYSPYLMLDCVEFVHSSNINIDEYKIIPSRYK